MYNRRYICSIRDHVTAVIFIFHVNGEERRGEWNVVLSVKSTEMRRKSEPQYYHEWPASYSNVENDIK
jgi:hypothetical protein